MVLRYLAELALAAREELKRVMAEEAPRERARLRKLEDELNVARVQQLMMMGVIVGISHSKGGGG